MKFLVDAQLPKSLSDLLNWKGLDSIHTAELPKGYYTSDNDIISLSILQNRVVITKDLDFLESYLVTSKPDKLILIRTGNITNSKLLDIFSSNFDLICSMISRSNLVEINTNAIVEHS